MSVWMPCRTAWRWLIRTALTPVSLPGVGGGGCCFQLICACEQARTGGSAAEVFEAMSRRFMDLVAIGTVADVMPLCDENRLIVSRGLEILNRGEERPGIAALLML